MRPFDMRALTPGRRRRPGAFTLIEVLVAIVLVGMIVVSLVGFMFNLIGRRDRAALLAKGELGTTALFARLEADLAMTQVVAADGSGGIVGGADQLTIRSRRAVPGVVGPSGSPIGMDECGFDVRFDAASNAIVARVVTKPANPSLMSTSGGTTTRDSAASETSLSEAKQDSPNAERSTAASDDYETVVAGVERLTIRYFVGREWVSTFDSARGGADGAAMLPSAVEVSIWFGGTGGGAPPEEQRNAENSTSTPKATRAPDRQRVIVVPDAPAAGWKEGA